MRIKLLDPNLDRLSRGLKEQADPASIETAENVIKWWLEEFADLAKDDEDILLHNKQERLDCWAEKGIPSKLSALQSILRIGVVQGEWLSRDYGPLAEARKTKDYLAYTCGHCARCFHFRHPVTISRVKSVANFFPEWYYGNVEIPPVLLSEAELQGICDEITKELMEIAEGKHAQYKDVRAWAKEQWQGAFYYGSEVLIPVKHSSGLCIGINTGHAVSKPPVNRIEIHSKQGILFRRPLPEEVIEMLGAFGQAKTEEEAYQEEMQRALEEQE